MQVVNAIVTKFTFERGQLMKKVLMTVFLAIGALVFTGLGAFLVFTENCEEVSGEVLRLHIPANSDSDEDQRIKLRVRDFILAEFSDELSVSENLYDAEEKARELLPEIEQKATDFLHENGFSYGAKAELVTMDFTTREYDRLILPAGNYRALRITLGSGNGHNWWCVIFPQLCLPSACETTGSKDILAEFGKPQGITLKFALFEWLSGLF